MTMKLLFSIFILGLLQTALAAADEIYMRTKTSSVSAEKCATGLILQALRDAGVNGKIIISMPKLKLNTPKNRGLKSNAGPTYASRSWTGTMENDGLIQKLRGFASFEFSNEFDSSNKSSLYECTIQSTAYNQSPSEKMARNASIEVSTPADSFPWFTDILYYPTFK